jgi:hypothetical protein
MSEPSPPLPAGPIGVGIRTVQLASALSQPLTPEEMWQQGGAVEAPTPPGWSTCC